MKRLVQAIPLPAALIGASQRVVCTNSGFDELFGEDVVGRYFVAALRQPAVIEAIEVAFRDAAEHTAHYLGRDGSTDATFQMFARSVGEDVLITFSDRTVTEAAVRMRSDFIANVSHELRTPLTALQGFIETLRGAARNDPETRDRFLQIMDQEAGRMTRLVDELMSLSRLEQVERTRPTEIVSLKSVLSAAQEGLEPILQAAALTMTLSLPADEIIVRGDFAQLQQVFTNLMENAVKYGAKGGRIDVALSTMSHQKLLRGAGAVVTVHDYGDGIASHHIPRLTERFYRVDSHRSRAVGGTGLGLAIVKHIVNRHRGRMKIDSIEGEGTTISVILPE